MNKQILLSLSYLSIILIRFFLRLKTEIFILRKVLFFFLFSPVLLSVKDYNASLSGRDKPIPADRFRNVSLAPDTIKPLGNYPAFRTYFTDASEKKE